MEILIGWAAIAAAWWGWYKFRNWEDRVADARFLEELRRHYAAKAVVEHFERIIRAREQWQRALGEGSK